MPIDPVEAYKTRILPYQPKVNSVRKRIERWENRERNVRQEPSQGTDKFKNTSQQLDPIGIETFKTMGKPADKQLEFDVALWYGHMISNLPENTRWKQEMVKRVFSILVYGGLMVNKGTSKKEDVWTEWAAQDAPICSAISHTARVMVWLPKVKFNDFWDWLWVGKKNETKRALATHGVKKCSETVITAGVKKGIKENKVGLGEKHFGVNLVLGGLGNIHPISGNIIQDTGHHGHLYLCRSKTKKHGRYGLLIATEQSAPADRETDAQGKVLHVGKRAVWKRSGEGVPDQYGGVHGRGGHNRFSTTGGDDFAYKKYSSELTQAGYGMLHHSHYLGGMFVDLNDERYNFVKRMSKNFTDEMVAHRGLTLRMISDMKETKKLHRRGVRFKKNELEGLF